MLCGSFIKILTFLKVSYCQKDFLLSSNSSNKRRHNSIIIMFGKRNQIRSFISWKNRGLDKSITTLGRYKIPLNAKSVGEKLKTKDLMFFASLFHLIFKITNLNL